MLRSDDKALHKQRGFTTCPQVATREPQMVVRLLLRASVWLLLGHTPPWENLTGLHASRLAPSCSTWTVTLQTYRLGH